MFDTGKHGGYPSRNFIVNLMMQGLTILFLASVLAGVLFPGRSAADVFVYKDKQGVLTFTNVPTHQGFRRVIRETNGQSEPISSANGYEGLIQSASERYSLDADLIRAVIRAESNFNSAARSNKGAMGLMQLMPDTARLHNVIDAYDPIDNIDGGVRHLKMLLGRYQGDLRLSLAAYNAGSQAVDRHGGIPPFVETRDYVRRVLQYYDTYRGGGLRTIQQVQRESGR
jgi:soluble lytic murein transglycosylase-like protein